MHRQQNIESQPWDLVHEDSERPILVEYVIWTIWSMRISSRGAYSKRSREDKRGSQARLMSIFPLRICTDDNKGLQSSMHGHSECGLAAELSPW